MRLWDWDCDFGDNVWYNGCLALITAASNELEFSKFLEEIWS